MSEDGRKFDEGKLKFSLIPLDALQEVVRVLMGGASKYTPGNWLHVEDARERYYNAAIRHLTVWFEGERKDSEWGLHHLAHACCCVLFLLALSLRGKIDAEEPIAVDLDELEFDEPIPFTVSRMPVDSSKYTPDPNSPKIRPK